METMAELKKYLKDSAVQIRELKSSFKESQREFTKIRAVTDNYYRYYDSYDLSMKRLRELTRLKRMYRHYHIAYSELRGKPRNRIEASYPYEGQTKYQKPDETLIKSIKSNIKPV